MDEAEDSQVTALVQKMLLGETFKPQDFPGGDRSFIPKVKVEDAEQEEQALSAPVHRRNFRPRTTQPIEVDESSSSSKSGEGNRQSPESCTCAYLKPWISQRFEEMEGSIEELRTLLCRSLGVPEGSRANTRKRKATEGTPVPGTPSPDSIGSEMDGRNSKGKKRKTAAPRLVAKKTLSRRRNGGGKEVTKVVRRSLILA